MGGGTSKAGGAPPQQQSAPLPSEDDDVKLNGGKDIGKLKMAATMVQVLVSPVPPAAVEETKMTTSPPSPAAIPTPIAAIAPPKSSVEVVSSDDAAAEILTFRTSNEFLAAQIEEFRSFLTKYVARHPNALPPPATLGGSTHTHKDTTEESLRRQHQVQRSENERLRALYANHTPEYTLELAATLKTRDAELAALRQTNKASLKAVDKTATRAVKSKSDEIWALPELLSSQIGFDDELRRLEVFFERSSIDLARQSRSWQLINEQMERLSSLEEHQPTIEAVREVDRCAKALASLGEEEKTLRRLQAHHIKTGVECVQTRERKAIEHLATIAELRHQIGKVKLEIGRKELIITSNNIPTTLYRTRLSQSVFPPENDPRVRLGDLLDSVAMFAGLDSSRYLMKRRTVESAGEVLVREGDPCPSLMLIDSGELEMASSSRAMNIGTRDVVGGWHEIAQVTVTSLTPCVVWTLERKHIPRSVLREKSRFAEAALLLDAPPALLPSPPRPPLTISSHRKRVHSFIHGYRISDDTECYKSMNEMEGYKSKVYPRARRDDEAFHLKSVEIIRYGEEALREIAVLKALGERHHNIVTVADTFRDDTSLYMALEFHPGGPLLQRVLLLPVVALDDALRWVRDIASALKFCHESRVCHRDVKLENIFIAADGSAVLHEFINSTVGGSTIDVSGTPPVGSPHYIAPEVLDGNMYNGPAADVWSLGVVLYALLYKEFPFDGPTNFDVLERVYKRIPPLKESEWLKKNANSYKSDFVKLQRLEEKDRRATAETPEATAWDQIVTLFLEEKVKLQKKKKQPAVKASAPAAVKGPSVPPLTDDADDVEELQTQRVREVRGDALEEACVSLLCRLKWGPMRVPTPMGILCVLFEESMARLDMHSEQAEFLKTCHAKKPKKPAAITAAPAPPATKPKGGKTPAPPQKKKTIDLRQLEIVEEPAVRTLIESWALTSREELNKLFTLMITEIAMLDNRSLEEQCVSLLYGMMCSDPSMRLTMDGVLRHTIMSTLFGDSGGSHAEVPPTLVIPHTLRNVRHVDGTPAKVPSEEEAAPTPFFITLTEEVPPLEPRRPSLRQEEDVSPPTERRRSSLRLREGVSGRDVKNSVVESLEDPGGPSSTDNITSEYESLLSDVLSGHALLPVKLSDSVPIVQLLLSHNHRLRADNEEIRAAMMDVLQRCLEKVSGARNHQEDPGRYSLLEALLEDTQGLVDVTVIGSDGLTVLARAAKNNDVRILRMLMHHHPTTDIHRMLPDGRTAADLADPNGEFLPEMFRRSQNASLR